MTSKKLGALAGFVVLGLSPSFVDWQQTGGDLGERTKIVAFYVIGLSLVYWGLLSG